MKAIWQRLAYLGLFSAALACGGEDEDSAVDVQQQWLESAPQQYVAKACSTGFTIRTCSVSAVSAGVPVAQLAQVPQLPESDAWEVVEPPGDVIVSVLNRSLREADEGCTLRVTQHETYAFPSRVFESCMGEGAGVEISCFVADTLDLSLCQ
jgi:hypothetical protein